jgi:hypothetical protein
MKKLFFAVCVFVVLFGSQSCVYVESLDDISPRGEGTRTFDFKNFTAVQAGNAFRVHIVAGNIYEVSATGELNDLDQLQIFVQKGELILRYNDGWHKRRGRIDIDIVMPVLTGVDFTEAVNSDVTGFENMDEIDFELSGASNCDFDGSAKRIVFDLTGASQLDLAGESKYLDGELTGASQVMAFNLPAEESGLDLSGASTARVAVSKYLKVDASGASIVRYRGNPAIQKQLSGGSTLRQD